MVRLGRDWLNREGEFHYEDNYKEDSIVFTSMEQSNARFYNKKFGYHWDYVFSDDPLGAFGSQAYDKGESNGDDWDQKNIKMEGI